MCLFHALIMSIAKVDMNRNYESYRKGWMICPVVRDLLDSTGIDMSNNAGI